MSERRKEIRKKLMTFTPVYNFPQKKLLGYLNDLTLQGAMVICPRPDDIDRRETLFIEFPGEPTDLSATQMKIQARVARCVQDAEDPHSFVVGFEFEEMLPEEEKFIQTLLERYHFRLQMSK